MTSDLLVLCSAEPGLVRDIVARLTGRCRLIECPTPSEATQLIEQHQPRVVLLDVRMADASTWKQTWGLVKRSVNVRFVLITHLGALDMLDVPDNLNARTTNVEVTHSSPDFAGVARIVQTALKVSASIDIGGTSLSTSEFITTQPDNGPSSLPPHLPANRLPLAQKQVGRYEASPPAPSIPDQYHTLTPTLRQMLERLDVAARHDVTILLIGETGTGKTHLARLIHESSKRRKHPLLTVACGALPGGLIESELFGHVKGSFTSAHADKDGKFVAAGKGTILLDEIDVLTPEQQVKLLRVIEQGQFEPVGSNETLKGEARIIAASNLDLHPLVESGRFRADLYYRLNTLSFVIPPLRDRLPDIEFLARHFVKLHAAKHEIAISKIEDSFIQSLERYPWPGNIREMENAIRSAVIYSRDGRLTANMLPPNIIAGAAGPASDPSVAACFSKISSQSLGNRIEFTEKEIIEQTLLKNSFSRTVTAKQLGISRVTLYNKMKKYGMMPSH